jgi:hypothetical protein
MGPWKTSVNPQRLQFNRDLFFIYFWFRSGRWKKRLLVRKNSIFPSRELIVFVSSTIIEDVRAMQKAGLASLAFFYCDFREDQRTPIRLLL